MNVEHRTSNHATGVIEWKTNIQYGLDKVKFPILTIGSQHGCLLWYLEAVQRSLWFSPNTRAAFLPGHKSVSSSFHIQNSMLDVRCSMFIFFSKPSTVPRRKNNLALMGLRPNWNIGPTEIEGIFTKRIRKIPLDKVFYYWEILGSNNSCIFNEF